MPIAFIKKIISVLRYKPEASNDHLEAYPERLHVKALPERRYLKTSRFLVMCALVSILFNFALCFIYIRNARQVETIIHNPASTNTFLYNLDYYHKELKPVEKPERTLDGVDLIFQNLITDYLIERYDMTSNMQEMVSKWETGGKIAAYSVAKSYELFRDEAKNNLAKLAQGTTQKIYIYSVRRLDDINFYEAIFDVYSLKENGYDSQRCPCNEQTKECLTCLRDTAIDVKRYKAFLRVMLLLTDVPDQEIKANINPYRFRVMSYHLLRQQIHPDNQWEDVDNILE